jgi:hypothetical protein
VGHGIAEEGGQTTHYDGGVAYFAAKATTHLAFAYGEFSGAIGTGLGAFLGYTAAPETGGVTAIPATELAALTLVLGAKGVHSLVLLNRTIQQAMHSPMASDGGGGGPKKKGLSREQQKSLRSLRQRMSEHESKLKAYEANPEAFDNKGFLKNAPNNQVRQRIIQSRIRHLESEIRGFRKQIEELERLR